MKTETHSTKNESRRDFEAFRKRLLAELQTHQQRVDRARNELPVDSDPDDEAGVASRSAYGEQTSAAPKLLVEVFSSFIHDCPDVTFPRCV